MVVTFFYLFDNEEKSEFISVQYAVAFLDQRGKRQSLTLGNSYFSVGSKHENYEYDIDCYYVFQTFITYLGIMCVCMYVCFTHVNMSVRGAESGRERIPSSLHPKSLMRAPQGAAPCHKS